VCRASPGGGGKTNFCRERQHKPLLVLPVVDGAILVVGRDEWAPKLGSIAPLGLFTLQLDHTLEHLETFFSLLVNTESES